MRARILQALGFCIAASAAAATPPAKPTCLATYEIDHNQSPLAEQRAAAKPLDDFPTHIAAAKIDKTYTPMKAGAPYLYLTPDKSAIVVDAAAFSDLEVADPTRMTAGQTAKIGTTRGPRGRALGEFLLRAGVLRSYWHIGATVCLESETADELVYSGTHVYFTNRKNEGHFRFKLQVGKDGAIQVVGL